MIVWLYLLTYAPIGSLGILTLGVDAAYETAVDLAFVDIRAHASNILYIIYRSF
jgi:hypothetical protein